MCASNSSHPPSDGSSETRRWVGLPMYLVEEEEVEDLLHPEVAITRRANAPENDPGTRSIIFRQEDYTESGDDNFEYIGLVRLEPASVEYDEELTAEELRDARASEPEEYDFPPRLEYPGCGGTVEKLDAVSDYESCRTCAVIARG